MAGPGALLLLGGLLGGLPQIPQTRGAPRGGLGGSETPPELEEEVSIVQRSDPQPPHCFTRTLHELSCFWDSDGEPDTQRFTLQYRLEQDPWQECPLVATALSPIRGSRGSRGSRFWCSLPAAATVTFVPLELRVLRGRRPPGRPPERPPKTSETTERTPKTSETTERPPKTTGTTGTPEGTPETTGTTETTERPPKTSETPEGTPKTIGTTETTKRPPKTSETTERPPETTGTTERPPKTSETTEGTPKTTGTPEGTPKTSERPPKISETTERPPEITGTPGIPPKTSEPPAEPPLFQRTIYIDQLVLPGPPRNVSVSAGGARGELCVRWAPPPGPYLTSSLVFELALSPPRGPPKTVGVPAGRREQGVGGLSPSTPYSVRARARPDGLSYGGFWSPWSPPASATTAPELDAVTLGLSCLLVLLVLGLGALGLLGHRRTLRAKLWPPVPGPEREFEGLFSNYGGNFQLWLCQGPGSPCAPPCAPSPPPELEEAVEEVGGGGGGASLAPPPSPATPPPRSESPPRGPAPPSGPSPSPSFEYALFEPGSALLRPSPRPTGPAPYANLAPPTKGAEPKWAGHAPHYVICS